MFKSKMKRFSIIISAYNVEKYIDTAIASIKNQDFKNYEIIVVNDGSTDRTLKILKTYKDIKLINNNKNIGLGESRNKAVNVAKGEYILYLDADDTLYSNDTLSNIDKTIGNKQLDICYFGVQYVGGSNKCYIPNEKNSTKEARIACDMHFAVSSKCWRKEFLIKKDIKFIGNMYYEDMPYSLKGTILAEKIGYGKFPIYNYYRNRDGSIMSTPSIKRCTDMFKVLEEIMKLYTITPNKYRPYLMSFIRNETNSTVEKIDIILNSIENGVPLAVMPKRNYKLNFGKLKAIKTNKEVKYGN